MNDQSLFSPASLLTLLVLVACLCTTPGLAQDKSATPKSSTKTKTTKTSPPPPLYSPDDLKALKQFTNTMNRELRALEKSTTSKRPYTSEQALRAISGPKTPAKIFRWVVDNIGFEPYVGALRGPAGALIAGSANSADQALLLNEMLNKSGFKTRFVLGTIQDYDLTQTLYSFTGSARLAAPKKPELLAEFAPEDYADRLQYAQFLSNHVWLEVQQPDGKYLPADPILAPLFGMTPAIAISRSESLPDIFHATLELQLIAKINDDQELPLLNITTPLDQYAYRTLSLGFVPDDIQANTVRPTLMLDNQPTVNKGERFPSEQIQNMELRYTMKIGRRETRWIQTLYQKPASQTVAPNFSQQHFAISFIPGWTANDQLTRLTHQSLKRVTDQLNQIAKNQNTKNQSATDLSPEQVRHRTLGDLAPLIHFAYLRNLDRLTLELSNITGVRPILQSPRVVTTAIAPQNNEFVITLNLQGDTLESMPMSGIPPAAATGLLTLYGRIKNQLEGELLTTTNTSKRSSIDSIFRQARREKIPFTTLHNTRLDFLAQLQVDSKTRNELKELTVDRGMILLLPTRPVLRNDIPHYGWWTLKPQNGALEGHYNRALFSTQTTTSSSSEQLQNTLDLSTHIYKTVQQVLDDSKQKGPLICKASRDIQRLSAGMCATTKIQKLPSLKECLQPKTMADSSIVTAEGLMKFATPDCEQQLKETRCGAVITAALLDGTLTLAAPEAPPASNPQTNETQSAKNKTTPQEEVVVSVPQAQIIKPYCP